VAFSVCHLVRVELALLSSLSFLVILRFLLPRAEGFLTPPSPTRAGCVQLLFSLHRPSFPILALFPLLLRCMRAVIAASAPIMSASSLLSVRPFRQSLFRTDRPPLTPIPPGLRSISHSFLLPCWRVVSSFLPPHLTAFWRPLFLF